MKIRVALLIEVDPQKWADSNGQIVDGEGHYAATAVRDDVRSYVLNAIQCSAVVDETDAEVTLS